MWIVKMKNKLDTHPAAFHAIAAAPWASIAHTLKGKLHFKTLLYNNNWTNAKYVLIK